MINHSEKFQNPCFNDTCADARKELVQRALCLRLTIWWWLSTLSTFSHLLLRYNYRDRVWGWFTMIHRDDMWWCIWMHMVPGWQYGAQNQLRCHAASHLLRSSRGCSLRPGWIIGNGHQQWVPLCLWTHVSAKWRNHIVFDDKLWQMR